MADDASGAAERLRLHLLVLRCQTGDDAAFEDLMREFGDRTLRYLRGLVGDGADDVQQEVWLAVYRSVSRLANPGAFRTWLFRTTRHRALDHLRRQSRERALIDDTPIEELEVSGSTSDENDAKLTDDMLQAIDMLTPAHREVLLLRYRDDMSYSDIALVVGCTAGTVRSRLHYAKQRLLEHRRAAEADIISHQRPGGYTP